MAMKNCLRPAKLTQVYSALVLTILLSEYKDTICPWGRVKRNEEFNLVLTYVISVQVSFLIIPITTILVERQDESENERWMCIS